MAHIRQILANLSISVSEFKKSPKSVIKAVKSEPIAVIIDDKPAFYCVPADILESLYSKFYEMNEIQNIQELNTDNDNAVVAANDDDDETFGVQDIFQTIEDEQATKLPRTTEDLTDPISNHVADPLDEEVANQLNNTISSLNQHLHSPKQLKGRKRLTTSEQSNDDQDNVLNTASLKSYRAFNAIDPLDNALDALGFPDDNLTELNQDMLDNDNELDFNRNIADSFGLTDDDQGAAAAAAKADAILSDPDNTISTASAGNGEKEHAISSDAVGSFKLPTKSMHAPLDVPEAGRSGELSQVSAIISGSSGTKAAPERTDTASAPTDPVPAAQNKTTRGKTTRTSTRKTAATSNSTRTRKSKAATDAAIASLPDETSDTAVSTVSTAVRAADIDSADKTAVADASGDANKSAESVLPDPVRAGSAEERRIEGRAAMREAIKEVHQEMVENQKNMRSLVCGPHSFTLEHVARTYSPYKQKQHEQQQKKKKKDKSKKDKSEKAKTHNK